MGSGSRLRPWPVNLGFRVLFRDNWGRALSVELNLVEREGQTLKLQLVIVDDGLDWIVGRFWMAVGWRTGRGWCGEGSVYGGEDVGEIPDDLGGGGEV